MKKFLIIFSYIISFCLLTYFGGTVFLDNYFNNYFYKTPNLVGLTKSEAKQMIPKNTITFKEVGTDYSKFEKGQIFMQEPSEGKVVKRGRSLKVWISLGENSITIPDFRGQQLYEVRNYLEEHGIKVKNISKIKSTFPYNSVVATTPGAGETLNANGEISLLVSNTVSTNTVKVPDLIGYTLEEAEKILNENSLFLGKITTKDVPSLENNIVISTSIETGKDVSAGSSINLTISEK